MAQKEANAELAKDEMQNLSEQVTALRKDISDITETISALGRTSRDAAIDRARDTAEELKTSGERHIRSIQNQAGELSRHASDAVRDKPVPAVALAAGLGFLIGLATVRR